MPNCRKCSVELNNNNWHNSSKKNYNYICKDCVKKWHKEYYSNRIVTVIIANCRVCNINLNNENQYTSSKKNHDYLCKNCCIKQQRKYHNTENGKRTNKTYRESEKGKEIQRKVQRKYYLSNKESVLKQHRKYYNTENGKKIIRKMRHRRRALGFNELNKYFKGSEGHHINKTDIIYIPRWLHRLVPYSGEDSESMKQINLYVAL